MKQISFKQSASKRIYDDYMKRIRKTTSRLSKLDQEDVLMEFNSHIFEGIQNSTAESEIDSLLDITQKLGTPEEVLKPLIADKKLEQAAKTFNPIHVFNALALNISNGIFYGILSLLYIVLFCSSFLIIAKIIAPSMVGLYYNGNDFYAVGLIDPEIIKGTAVREVLGYWFIPFTLILLATFYSILTFSLRFKNKSK